MSSKPNKRKCSFKIPTEAKYSKFSPGRNESEAKCNVCDCYITVASRGNGSLDRHLETEKHKNSVRSSAGCSKVDNFFSPKFTKLDDQVSAAEGTVAFHTIKHHFSYRSNDCTSPLFKIIFSDSVITKNYTCARTKTEAIVNNVLGPHSVEIVIEELKNISHCGISVDGSNHKYIKLFPILIQYFDWKGGMKIKIIELK